MKKVKLIVFLVLIAIVIALVVVKINSSNRNVYQIEKIDKFNYLEIYKNEKYGVIDTQGKIIIDPIYESVAIPNPTKAIFICYTSYNSQTGEYKAKVLNDKKQELFNDYEQVLPIMCENSTSSVPYEKSVLKYKENGQYGLIDFEGNIITKAVYDEIESLKYREGCLKIKQNDKYGIINILGTEIIKPEYEDITSDEYFNDENQYMEAGFIVKVRTDDGFRYGYMDKNGRRVLKTEYNGLERVNEIKDRDNVYLLFSKNGKYGAFKNGQVKIPSEYEQIDYSKENNQYIVKKNAKQGVMSIDGEEILPTEFDNIQCTGTKIVTTKGENVSIYNSKGQKQDFKFTNIIETSNEDYIITIDNNGLYGVASKNGQVLIQNDYNSLEYAFDTYFIASRDEKVGVIDINLGVCVPFEYDIIQHVRDKNIIQAMTIADNKTDIFNNKMEKQISLKNVRIYIFDKYVKLLTDTEMYYLNNDGDLTSNKNLIIGNKLYAYTDNDKWGFVDVDGNIIVEAKYDLVTEVNKYGFAGIKLNNKWGVIDQSGKIILEPIYEINWDEPEFVNKYYKLNYGYVYTDN